MKVLVVAVFSTTSTNNSQARGFKHLGHKVLRYNYRVREKQIGNILRDQELVDLSRQVDLIFLSKCNGISNDAIKEMAKNTVVCFWFMDALCNWNREFEQKARVSTFTCIDKVNILQKIKRYIPHCYHVVEGFDHLIDKPWGLKKIYDLSFIGGIYGQRADYRDYLNFTHFSNAFGTNFSKVVSQSKINLNLVTADGASDRVYKIPAAKGFLITQDWTGRQDIFEDGKHLVIFNSKQDAKDKINYYLEHEAEREQIAEQGFHKVQKYNRDNFAQQIIDIAQQFI